MSLNFHGPRITPKPQLVSGGDIADVKLQDKIITNDGVYTADNGEIPFYAYYVSSDIYPDLIGGYFWVKGVSPELGASVYGSKPDETADRGIVPDLDNVLGVVSALYEEGVWLSVDFIKGYSFGHWDSDPVYMMKFDYTGLGTVTVKILDSFLAGNLPQNLQSDVTSLGDFSLYSKSIRTLSLPKCKYLGNQSVSSCYYLTKVDIPEYEGITINPETGEPNFAAYGEYAFSFCSNLEELNAPKLQIIPNAFLSNVMEKIKFDAPNIIGLCGSAFSAPYRQDYHPSPYQLAKEYGLDIKDMQYLGWMGDFLEDYIAAPENGITDTLTFNNLKTIGNNIFYAQRSHDLLNRITKLEVPNVTWVADYAGMEIYNITEIDLPKVIHIGTWAFEYCSSLTTVNIGDKIESIADGAFGGRSNLTININKPEGSISGAPWGASGVNTVNWLG